MLAVITVADYMTKRIVTFKEDTGVVDAIQTLLDHQITSAPVVNDRGVLVGMFSERDCMKVVLETAYNRGLVGKVGEFTSRAVKTVDAGASILDIAQQFEASEIGSFPVLKDSELVGIVSRTDVLKALIKIEKEL